MPRTSPLLLSSDNHQPHAYSKSEKTKKSFPSTISGTFTTTTRPLITFSIFCHIVDISGTVFSLLALSRHQRSLRVFRCGRVTTPSPSRRHFQVTVLSSFNNTGETFSKSIASSRVGKQRFREARVQAVGYLILLLAGACLGTLAKVTDETFGALGYTYTVIAILSDFFLPACILFEWCSKSIIHPVFDRGILVLGSTVEPGIVYTPLVPSQYITDIFRCMPHYNFNLESITINNQKLAIDASVFTTSTSTGTIIDSGPTLAYLAKAAYDPFVNAISAAVSQSVRPLLSRGNSCFLITSSALNNQTLMNVVIMS